MLKDIRASLIKEAREEGEASLQKAEAQVEAELSGIKAEGEAGIKAAEASARELVESERRERLSWAKLESKRIISEAEEDAVREAFEKVAEEIRKYAATKKFADALKPAILSAIREMGGKPFLRVRKGHRKLYSVSGAEVREDADVFGGAIVESRDGRMRVDLSVDTMLEIRRDAIRKAIYERMFK